MKEPVAISYGKINFKFHPLRGHSIQSSNWKWVRNSRCLCGKEAKYGWKDSSFSTEYSQLHHTCDPEKATVYPVEPMLLNTEERLKIIT